jgi:hypothetical protein
MNTDDPVRIRTRYLCLLIALLGFVLGANTARLPDEVYVLSLRAPLFSEPRTGAELLATASRGDRLRILEKEGRWFRVSLGSIEAWVHELLVGSEAPMGRVSVLSDEVELGDNARRRASEISSAAASRGLTEAAREELAGVHAADYEALTWLEEISRQISMASAEEPEG